MKKVTQEPAAAVFGGRRFTAFPAAEMTVGQKLHYMQLYAKSGLKSVTTLEGEDPGDFVLRLLDELIGAGLVLEMLGVLLIPDGMRPKDWTPEKAKETAAFLGSLTGEEDMAAVQSHVVSLLLDFFERGLISFWSSRRSLAGTTKGQPRKRGAPIPSVH